MTAPYRQDVTTFLKDQDVSPEQGLSHEAVKSRRARFGPNRLKQVRQKSAWGILVDQLESLVVILLGVAAGLSMLFGHWVEGIAIAAALLVNTVIGFVMEYRAVRSMEALRRLGGVKTNVRRDAQVQTVSAESLVPGDIVVLEAGDVVTADLRLVEAANLQCDEAALTGESVPVTKTTEAIDREVPIGDRTNTAHKGTAVTGGSGMGVVAATGMDTELGRISSLVEEAEEELTPLEKRLDALGRRLIWVTLAIAVVVAGAGIVAGKDLFIMLETAIALAIAAVPEGLPIVSTIALAHGMHRMAQRNAVVKRLSAVEALGAANVIMVDKTGTLTENRMTVKQLSLADGDIQVARQGDFQRDDETIDAHAEPALVRAVENGVLCNNASLQDQGGVGDPLEVALLAMGRQAGLDRDQLLDRHPEVKEIAFDTDSKMMATIHQADDGYRFAVKGAPEAVLAHCTQALTADGIQQVSEDTRQDWLGRNEAMASQGLRVLAIAEKRAESADDEPYAALTMLALVGLYDPPRPHIDQAIATCRQAGIRVVMVTGDHAATAGNIARTIGITADGEGRVSTASDFDQWDEPDDDHRQRLLDTTVFARISPEQKLTIVKAYQESGRVVGMTGDGVNDAPALKKADIGIAMGERGTEVAREAADMVLKDDAFDSILAAIEHGRTIFKNIRKFIVYLLSGNLAEIMAVSLAAVAGAPLPLLPLQILFINFVSDVLPALALGVGRGTGAIMREQPRAMDEPILTRRLWTAVVGYGAIIAGSVLGTFVLALNTLGMETTSAVTVSFLSFGFARLWHVFNMRDQQSRLLNNEVTANGFVWMAVAIGALLLLAAMYLPGLNDVLGTKPLGWSGWMLILAGSLVPLLIGQAMKLMGLAWERPVAEDVATK